jgi:hypothetical protein
MFVLYNTVNICFILYITELCMFYMYVCMFYIVICMFICNRVITQLICLYVTELYVYMFICNRVITYM